MQWSHDADCKWAVLWYLQPAQGPNAGQHLLITEVAETIATQIVTGTDALRGSYCQFKGEQLGSKPHVPCLISYVRVSISWTSWNFSFPPLRSGAHFVPPYRVLCEDLTTEDTRKLKAPSEGFQCAINLSSVQSEGLLSMCNKLVINSILVYHQFQLFYDKRVSMCNRCLLNGERTLGSQGKGSVPVWCGHTHVRQWWAAGRWGRTQPAQPRAGGGGCWRPCRWGRSSDCQPHTPKWQSGRRWMCSPSEWTQEGRGGRHAP